MFTHAELGREHKEIINDRSPFQAGGPFFELNFIDNMSTELDLLKMLKQRDLDAYETLSRICRKQLITYSMVKMDSAKRGKKLVDDLFSKWLDEGFRTATSPLSQWMMAQIDAECFRLQTAVN